MKKNCISTVENEINLYSENQMTYNYKTEKKKLRNIVDQPLSTVDPES